MIALDINCILCRLNSDSLYTYYLNIKGCGKALVGYSNCLFSGRIHIITAEFSQTFSKFELICIIASVSEEISASLKLVCSL